MEITPSVPNSPDMPKPKEFSVNVKIKGLLYIFEGTIPQTQDPSGFSWKVHIPYYRGLAPKMSDGRNFADNKGRVGAIYGDATKPVMGKKAISIGKIETDTSILPKDSPYYDARGIGHFLMDNFLALADIKGWTVTALLQPNGRLSYREMEAWVRRKGFSSKTAPLHRDPQKPDMSQVIAQILSGQEVRETGKFDGEIRFAKKRDLPYLKRILEMWVKWEGKVLTEEVEGDLDHVRRNLNAFESEVNERYLVAEDLTGRILGMMGLVFEPKAPLKPFARTDRPMELVRAYVDDDFRGGKGVGTALIKHIESLAKSKGATEILLDSVPRYEKSGHGFYDKMGYQRVGTIPNLYGPDGTAIVWQKVLS